MGPLGHAQPRDFRSKAAARRILNLETQVGSRRPIIYT